VVLCTGNVCRSPMAEAVLRHRLEQREVDARVSSAGSVSAGRPPTDEVIEVMRSRRLDVSGHTSRVMTAAQLEAADLIVAMARVHVRDAVVLAPGTFDRCFTLKELVRLGSEVGPRGVDEQLADWLARVGEGRQRSAMLGDSEVDDVGDPMGRRYGVFKKTAATIDSLVGRLVELAFPAPAA
jgi:protein-tyrosine phosphatase